MDDDHEDDNDGRMCITAMIKVEPKSPDCLIFVQSYYLSEINVFIIFSNINIVYFKHTALLYSKEIDTLSELCYIDVLNMCSSNLTKNISYTNVISKPCI